MLNLTEQLERWIAMHADLGGVATLDLPYRAAVHPAVRRDFPDWEPHPDLLTLRDYWDRLPAYVLPGIGAASDIADGTGVYADIGQFYRDGYRKVSSPLHDKAGGQSTMAPQAIVNVFYTDAERFVGVETVGPAAGSVAIYRFGEVGWVARSIAELFDRASFLAERNCCELAGGSLSPIPDRIHDLINALVSDGTRVDRVRLAGYVQECLVDPRLVRAGYATEADWLRWRWE